MDLGEYLSNAFSIAFKPKPYLSALFVTIVTGIIYLIGFFAFFWGALGKLSSSLTPLLMGGKLSTTTLLVKVLALLGVGFIVFAIVVGIIMLIGYAFILRKIDSESNKTNETFFAGFGQSFVMGLKLLVAGIVWGIFTAILYAIIFAVGLIPVVGWIFAIILAIIFMLYLATGNLILFGVTYKEGIGQGIAKAFTLPFKKIHLVGYSFVFMLIICVICLILGLLNLIPVLGQIIYILGLPLVMVLFLTFSYLMASE
jgi:hypothetical protein